MKKFDLQRLRDRSRVASRRLQLDLVILAGMLVLMICVGHGSARWFLLGAIAMFVPILYTHASKALDVALILDRAGFERGTPGRHSGQYTGRQ